MSEQLLCFFIGCPTDAAGFSFFIFHFMFLCEGEIFITRSNDNNLKELTIAYHKAEANNTS